MPSVVYHPAVKAMFMNPRKTKMLSVSQLSLVWSTVNYNNNAVSFTKNTVNNTDNTVNYTNNTVNYTLKTRSPSVKNCEKV